MVAVIRGVGVPNKSNLDIAILPPPRETAHKTSNIYYEPINY